MNDALYAKRNSTGTAPISNPFPLLSLVAILLIGGYIAAHMISNIASIKITRLFTLAVDAGTFLYPLTFTMRDLIHKQLGKANAQRIVIATGIINLFMAAFFAFVIWLPSDSSWANQNEFRLILGPAWRIVFASITAAVISELVDTEVYHLFITRVTKRFEWLRVLTSNAISIPLDSILFALIAFAGLMTGSVILEIIIANILIKYAVTLISLPAIYLVKPHKDHMH
jgi:queuosine precursor transporter